MSKMKPWIEAARLRTLPLAFSCIILGNFLAASNGSFNVWVLILSLLTTLFFQVLSNLANDYGDGVKGTDNEDRIGPARAVQSGVITAASMKKGVVLFSFLSILSGTSLSILATYNLSIYHTLFFTGLGILATIAAIKYTVGKGAYGYAGLGDLFVLIFFGWVGVVGSYYLQTNSLDWEIFLPATSVGFLSMGVLNLNNMRDMESDKKAGKNTLASRLGKQNSKIYHAVLLVGALDLTYIYGKSHPNEGLQYLFALTLIPILINLKKVFKNSDPAKLDPLLKQLAITTLLFSLLTGLGQVL